MIKRKLENIIKNKFNKNKVIIIFGPRQVGKTTLLKQISSSINQKILWLNGDESDIREMLSNTNSTILKNIISDNQFVIIDEAQRINNIGLTLKILVDNFPDIQIIATGSSSFELANEISEPLTGRKYEYLLYPLSFSEMCNHNSFIEESRLLNHRLVYGYYPEVITNQDEDKEILKEITNSYLYKDLFTYEKIKKPALLEKILQALSFQIGNEVSYNEIANLIGIDKGTVEKYINLLEKTYVVFTLRSFRRNLRNELKKSRKIYFYDNGIRNSIIKNFNPVSLRQDLGALWENFLISERQKYNEYLGNWVNSWFWRTHSQQEIDYLEEYNGKIYAYEFKWSEKSKVKFSKTFANSYPNSELKVINRKNYFDFIHFDFQK